MTLNPVCESVETAQGVPLTVTGVAQVKIMKMQIFCRQHQSNFSERKSMKSKVPYYKH